MTYTLPQWRITAQQKESSGNEHETLNHSHYLFTAARHHHLAPHPKKIVIKWNKNKNMERSLHGKLSVVSLEKKGKEDIMFLS